MCVHMYIRLYMYCYMYMCYVHIHTQTNVRVYLCLCGTFRRCPYYKCHFYKHTLTDTNGVAGIGNAMCPAPTQGLISAVLDCTGVRGFAVDGQLTFMAPIPSCRTSVLDSEESADGSTTPPPPSLPLLPPLPPKRFDCCNLNDAQILK